MKYQLITYTNLSDIVVVESNDTILFDQYAMAISEGKHATLNEKKGEKEWQTIKMKSLTRNENKKDKPKL